jgi:hypothetical protein
MQNHENQTRMASMVYAVESWILALIGWAWLSFQEVWAWSLLSAHVFYGLMFLSTCNVAASGVAPESAGPRSAYFAAVLAFFLHTVTCVLDTLPMPTIAGFEFVSPLNSTTCTLARSNQYFFFSDSQLYLAQAGATLAYFIIQLSISGAALLDSDRRTLWPGPAWGAGVCVLLCGRFVSTFDGMASGTQPGGGGKYFSIFSLPVAEFSFLFYGFMYLLGILIGVDGLLFPGLAWRRSVRYVTFTAVLLFVAFTGWTLFYKGLMTPSLLTLLILILLPAIVGTIEAAQAVELPPPPPPLQPPASSIRQYPGYQPTSVMGFPPTFNVPPQPWGSPTAPTMMSRQMGEPRRLRHIIPTPVEMLVEKNKGV